MTVRRRVPGVLRRNHRVRVLRLRGLQLRSISLRHACVRLMRLREDVLLLRRRRELRFGACARVRACAERSRAVSRRGEGVFLAGSGERELRPGGSGEAEFGRRGRVG